VTVSHQAQTCLHLETGKKETENEEGDPLASRGITWVKELVIFPLKQCPCKVWWYIPQSQHLGEEAGGS
jgi:hypothetical protein